MIETILAIAEDQRVIAGLALLLFSIFILACYIIHAERKSRIRIEPNEMDGDELTR